MRFVNKGQGQPYFWVEDYTPEQKSFFESIGFQEKKYGPDIKFPTKNDPNASAQKKTMQFKGSEIFGLWSKKEMKKICYAIYEQFPEIEQIEVEVMNPFD